MRIFIVTLFALLLFGPSAVQAHKVVASIYPGNGVVEGEIGFSNGDMAADALVEVFDASGAKLGEARTDSDGFFSFRPSVKTDLVFKANLGAGHIAEVQLAAAEVIIGKNSAAVEPVSVAAAPSTATSAPPPESLTSDQRAVVVEEIRRAIRPLQKEIAAYKEKHDIQSILGGLGYIAGLFGIGYYVAARRQIGT